MSTGTIIEQFDVLGDLGLGHITSRVDALLGPLIFQAAKKQFGHRFIPAVSTPTHAGHKVMRVAEAPPGIAAKLRALIGMNRGVCGLASMHGHEERVQDEVLRQHWLAGPADNAAGVQVHHDGQIEPAFPPANIGNVGDPGMVQA